MWRFEMKDGVISIHALRKESDEQQSAKEWKMTHFNPRSP